ncbi:MAG: hypothetical protein Q8R30_05110 [bacterium]|nr:hypothetical protein [bacterium]
MKNEKRNVVVIAIIIVIAAIAAGVIIWLATAKTQAPVQRAIITQPTTPAVQTQSETQQIIDPLVYVNKNFGFQLKLPANFSGY